MACGTCASQKSDYDVFVVVVAVAAAAVFVVKVMSLLLLLSLCWIDSNTGRCKPFAVQSRCRTQQVCQSGTRDPSCTCSRSQSCRQPHTEDRSWPLIFLRVAVTRSTLGNSLVNSTFVETERETEREREGGREREREGEIEG